MGKHDCYRLISQRVHVSQAFPLPVSPWIGRRKDHEHHVRHHIGTLSCVGCAVVRLWINLNKLEMPQGFDWSIILQKSCAGNIQRP